MVEKVRMSGPTLKLLRFLLEKPLQGQSGAAISKATGLGSGTMYPLLQRLEIAKWIEGEWEKVDPADVGRPKRRFYKLTKSGQTEAVRALRDHHVVVPGVPAWT